MARGRIRHPECNGCSAHHSTKWFTSAPVAGVADHNPTEWGLWVNRPLLGQWTWDLIRWLDFLDEQSSIREAGARTWRPARPYILIGLGAMSLPTVLAGALDRARGRCFVRGILVSYVGRERGRGRTCRWDYWRRGFWTWLTSASLRRFWPLVRSC